jgi:hypothetical protein
MSLKIDIILLHIVYAVKIPTCGLDGGLDCGFCSVLSTTISQTDTQLVPATYWTPV